MGGSKWKWPAIQGIHDFKRRLLHSASWDAGYDFAGKRVAVIGAGSSAIQIVPKLTPGMGLFPEWTTAY